MTIQWSLVLFTLLTGTAGWAFACVAWDKLSSVNNNADKSAMAAAVAAVVMLAGGCVSVTHLAHPENIMAALNRPSSGIFVEATLTGLALICMVVFIILAKRNSAEGAQKALGVIGAILGIVLSFAAGNSYVMAASATWSTPALPCAYLGTAMPAGIALYSCCVSKGADADTASRFGKALIVAGIVALVTSLIYGFACGFAGMNGALIACAAVFSGVLPIVCGVKFKDTPEKMATFAVIALVGALIGALALRCLMWVAFAPAAVGAPYITPYSSL